MKYICKLTIYACTLVLSSSNIVFAQKKEKERIITGTATWYSNSFNGRKTASGEIFTQKKYTCATNRFKIGTWLKVEDLATGKSVLVRVNDRMASHPRKIIDLTRAAAEKIGIIKKGCAKVKIESMGRTKPEDAD